MKNFKIFHLVLASSICSTGLTSEARTVNLLEPKISQIEPDIGDVDAPYVSQQEEIQSQLLLLSRQHPELKWLQDLVRDEMFSQNEMPGPLLAENGSSGTRMPAQVSGLGKKAFFLNKAKKLVSSGQYQEASKLLFQMAVSPMYINESAQIKYILGLMLYELKLHQSAAFIFYDVVRQESGNTRSKYLRQSLEKLSLAADALNSDVLLKFAIKKINENDFPPAQRDMLFYRMGEVKLQDKNFKEAAQAFVRVRPTSTYYSKARYNLALALAEAGDTPHAREAFDDLYANSPERITDRNRVDSILGKARVLYQGKDWDTAIETYRLIPRDTEQWHESLFESSWAMLRSGKFRSALSNFHSLHSPFYEDFYQPESFILRAIVYLYICRYEEMDKILNLFERIYKPVQSSIRNSLVSDRTPETYYREITQVANNYDAIRTKKAGSRGSLRLPFVVARQVLKESDVRKAQSYLSKLIDEQRRLAQFPVSWTTSGVGKYSKRVVEKRVEATRSFIGRLVRRHLILLQNDLRDLFEQVGFLRFEKTSGQKAVLKKEIQGKGLAIHIDDDDNRDYFIQNGYEYWPFKGEYWLDEIGNYHYVGVQACEK